MTYYPVYVPVVIDSTATFGEVLIACLIAIGGVVLIGLVIIAIDHLISERRWKARQLALKRIRNPHRKY